MAVREASFSPALFEFLAELRLNNDREWFQANRTRYETSVRAPAIRFIEAAGPRLATLSPHLVADPRPVGGSMFRINRDIRFSADKSPYKTAVGISFLHELGRTRPAPGLYLHLEPRESFAGGGVHMPDGPSLTRIRDAIVGDPATWGRIVGDRRFAPMHANMGESLKRVPSGYDPGSPHADDLRRKSHTWHVSFSEKDVCSPGFIDAYIDACSVATPFHRFMAKALGVAW